MPGAACGFGLAELVMVGGVPPGARLIRYSGVDFELLGLVECSSKADSLREDGGVRGADAVAGL